MPFNVLIKVAFMRPLLIWTPSAVECTVTSEGVLTPPGSREIASAAAVMKTSRLLCL
jgi:hypothetical protein